MENIRNQILESIDVKRKLLTNNVNTIRIIAKIIVGALRNDKRVYLMGNGGSAADAQHFAAEMIGRYKKNRKPLPVIAFTTDSSVITAIANDFGYEYCFVKQVDAFVKKDDVVIGISTSGNSQNIINAMDLARQRRAGTIAFTGANGGFLKNSVDVCLQVPSDDTARIQESHITIIHILCSIIEDEVFK
ncbi:MAG: D-sedoheptulose-7-phosphate isomerase [Candidatus Anammoxibacter sp.]